MVPTNGALGGLPDGGLVFCHDPTARRPSGWLSLSHSRGFARYSTILSAESRVGSLEMQFDLDICVEALPLAHAGFSAETPPFPRSSCLL